MYLSFYFFIVQMDDLYTILGVSNDAKHDDIKKAYRKLQMKHHPDKGGDPEICKKINDAYSILGDTERRQQYDMQKNNPFNGNLGMHNAIFKMFFGGGMGGMPGWMNMGGGFQGPPQMHIFHNGKQFNMNMLRKPMPIIKHIEISLEEAFKGTNIPLEIERWCQDGDIKRVEREKIYVNVRAGIDDNEIITIPQKGNIINDNLRGDIKINVKIKNTSDFTRKGLHLIYKKKITLKEALTGFKFDLTHLSGKTYVINNQEGRIIKPSFHKVIQHMGMRRERRHPAPPLSGDLIVTFDIVFPDSLTDEQITKLKEIL